MTKVKSRISEKDIRGPIENGCVCYVDWTPELLVVQSMECCGWFCVSNFYVTPLAERVKKELSKLSLNSVFGLDGDESEESSYALHCVLTRQQEKIYKKDLLSLGWQPMTSFRNPNTGNVCTPYILVPDECKV